MSDYKLSWCLCNFSYLFANDFLLIKAVEYFRSKLWTDFIILILLWQGGHFNKSHRYFLRLHIDNNRSSGPEVFCEKGVLKNFAKFTEKHLCQIPFFNTVAGLTLLQYRLWQACIFIKKETLAEGLSCEFCKIFKNTFFLQCNKFLVYFKFSHGSNPNY